MLLGVRQQPFIFYFFLFWWIDSNPLYHTQQLHIELKSILHLLTNFSWFDQVILFLSLSLPPSQTVFAFLVNILTICSGRYERFLKIMILSVLKNTRRPVKFWFIKNYLSPQFKVVYVYDQFFFCQSFILFCH